MKQEVTLIGGKASGERINIPSGSKYHVVHVYEDGPKAYDPRIQMLETTQEVFRSRIFVSDSEELEVWGLDSMSDTQVLRELIKHYKPT